MSTNNKVYEAATNGVQYYGTDANQKKALSSRYYGKGLCLSIHKPLPENKQTNHSVYDYKAGTEIWLQPKGAKSLAKCICKVISEILNGDKVKGRSITSGANLIEVCEGSKHGLDQGSVALVMYKNVKDDKTTEEVDVFCFKNDTIITDYDNKTGHYELDEIEADIDYFITQLKEYSKGMTKGMAHAYKHEMKFHMDRQTANTIKMMSAMGVESNSGGNKGGWNKGGGGGWDKKPNNSSSSSDKTLSLDIPDTNDLLADIQNL